LIYLDLAVLSFLSLASLRMLRNYYLIEWRGNGRYYLFFIVNMVVSYFYGVVYEINCGRDGICAGEVTMGEKLMAFFPTFIHLFASVDALKATR